MSEKEILEKLEKFIRFRRKVLNEAELRAFNAASASSTYARDFWMAKGANVELNSFIGFLCDHRIEDSE